MTTQLCDGDIDLIFGIWNSVYPQQATLKTRNDLRDLLTSLINPKHFIKRDTSGRLIGWLSTFDRNDRRFFILIVNEDHHGKGLGKALIEEAKQVEVELNGWMAPDDSNTRLDGSVYRSPVSFYQRLDFKVINETMLKDGLLSVRIQWCPTK